MEQCAAHAAQREQRVVPRLAGEADTEGEQDDPDVLDARIGQQALQVILYRSRQDAPEACDDAEHEEDEAHGEQPVADGQRDAQNTIYAHLDHHARHQRRDMRRRGRVRLRQPDVEREHTGLHPESDEEDEEERQRIVSGEVERERVERRGQLRGPERDESRYEEYESDVHQDQVVHRGPAHLAAFGVEEDEHERADGHQFPHEQEAERSAAHDHADHRVVEQREGGIVQ